MVVVAAVVVTTSVFLGGRKEGRKGGREKVLSRRKSFFFSDRVTSVARHKNDGVHKFGLPAEDAAAQVFPLGQEPHHHQSPMARTTRPLPSPLPLDPPPPAHVRRRIAIVKPVKMNHGK